jgi:hypothetical protein
MAWSRERGRKWDSRSVPASVVKRIICFREGILWKTPTGKLCDAVEDGKNDGVVQTWGTA